MAVVTNASPKRGEWASLVAFLCFSALDVWLIVSGTLTFRSWKDWLIVLGAFMWPAFALIAARELVTDPEVAGLGRAVARAIQWVLVMPFALLGCVLAGWALHSAFGWIATIPSWATVIIVLLFALLMKNDRHV